MSRILRSTDIKSALKARQKGFILNPFRFASGAASDPYWANVVLLMHMDGPGATDFIDSSPYARTFTRIGTPSIVSDAEAFAGYEMSWSDTISQYITATTLPGGNFLSVANGPLTVECLVHITSITGGSGYSDLRWSFLRLTSAGVKSLEFSAGPSPNYTFAIPAAYAVGSIGLNRVHLAMVRDPVAPAMKIYVNGNYITGAGAITSWNFDTVNIGHSSAGTRTCGGKIEEVRITEAVRYNANFTPPTSAFPDS